MGYWVLFAICCCCYWFFSLSLLFNFSSSSPLFSFAVFNLLLASLMIFLSSQTFLYMIGLEPLYTIMSFLRCPHIFFCLHG